MCPLYVTRLNFLFVQQIFTRAKQNAPLSRARHEKREMFVHG